MKRVANNPSIDADDDPEFVPNTKEDFDDEELLAGEEHENEDGEQDFYFYLSRPRS